MVAPLAVPPRAAETPTGDGVCRRSVFGAVARRALPNLVEATFVPAILFYACLLAFGTWVAFVCALGWSYGAIARRAVSGRRVPAILVLSTLALTVRTTIAMASGSTFVYFFQPVLGTLAMAFVFVGSIAVGRPLVATLAADFWPLTPDVASHPAVVRLFRRLTLLWAGVNLATAATTFVLLLTLPVAGFVPAKTVTGYAITVSGVLLTISLSISTARRHDLVHAATRLSTLAVAPPGVESARPASPIDAPVDHAPAELAPAAA
jgi:uncharacterized membrane protein